MSSKKRDHEFLTTDEVAARWRVHPWTVRNMVKKGELPIVKIGPGTVRYRMSAIEAYESGQVGAGSEG